MKCEKCQTYKSTNGRGNKSCLRCKQYSQFQKDFTKRETIQYTVIPDEILENIEDLSARTPEFLEQIRKLSDELGSVISLIYVLKLTDERAAKQLHLSIRTVKRRRMEGEYLLIRFLMKIY